jgi:two-component system, NarL family, sensor kinase
MFIMKALRYRFIQLLILVFLFSVIVMAPVDGQNLDSLENVLRISGLKPENKIKICDDLSWGYLNSDFLKSKSYALQGIAIAENENDLLMTGTLYRNLGVAYYMASILDTANIYLDTAMEYAHKSGDENLEALVDFARANLYNLSGDYTNALALYLKSLPVFEKTGNKQKVRTVLGNIGVLYSSLQNLEQAEKYYLKAEKLSTEINDKWGLAQAYNGLGIIYSGRNEYKKALEYTLRSEKIAHESGDIQTEALAAQTVAEVYFAYYKDFDKAESYAKKGLKLAEELGYPGNIAAMLNSLSNIYFHQGRYDASKEYALRAITTDTTDLNVYSNMAANVVRSGILTGDDKNALKFFNIYRRAIDYRAEREYQNAIMEMQTRYETERKEVKLTSLERQKKLGITIIVLGSVISILVIVILFFRHRNLSNKKNLAEQRVIQLEQEKQLTATQAVLKGETTERARIARDLHDGLGGMLSVVKLKLIDMKGNLILPESDVPQFQNALGLLDNSITELRRVARNLMPESLMRYGLRAALTDYCRDINLVHLHFYGEERRLEEKIEIALFRIVQELVNNSLKHSGAGQINVQLIYEDNRVNLVVQDNGKGFEVNHTDTTKTTGLNSIRSRVESLNGKLDLLSSPGKGTEVNVDLIL